MWKIVRRALLPILVLAVGIAGLAYGVQKHTARVFEERVEEIEIPVSDFGPPGIPPEFAGPPGMGGMPGFPGPPGEMLPFGPPPPRMQKVTQKTIVEKSLPELAIIRDVTIGGLVLEARGLRRTYSGSGPPPSLCPT